MNTAAVETNTREIVVDEVFPHAPEKIWKTLTNGVLMARWLMEPTGFAAVKGTQFTFKTKPGGAWDGVIQCQVLDVAVNERLVYSWKGGHADNEGYGAPLDTVVSWTLTAVDGGTRLRVVHSGFVSPRNDYAHEGMGRGWRKIVAQLGAIAGEG